MNFEDYETLPTQSSITHMTAGAIAGVMEHCVMYPLDSVKTRMQSLRSAHNGSIMETFRYMVQREGFFRPIRGMSAVVMGAGPAHACFFATYEQSKHTLSQLTRHRHDHIIHGLSGCLASLVHDAVSNPTEDRVTLGHGEPHDNNIDKVLLVLYDDDELITTGHHRCDRFACYRYIISVACTWSLVHNSDLQPSV
ncbi:putative mitochondrial RNA splicing protein [Danaus plexippus plexippus]|uniref:Mitochondrial RNA splicing protein n=1 Tax=Danaus plexippus plexippus TaxID=278856 RepID=A0A212FE94_DANPL|nr:putative mitochondrial RNA splicing protein [Danaus plexippus plexippus]